MMSTENLKEYVDTLNYDECLEVRKDLKSIINILTDKIKRQQSKDWNKSAMTPCAVCGKLKTQYNRHLKCEKCIAVVNHSDIVVDLS